MPRALGGTERLEHGRISLVMPNQMKKQLRAQMDIDGYTVRKRSRWICEAISSLFKLDNYHELVEEDYIKNGNNVSLNVTLAAEVNREMAIATEKVKDKTGLKDVRAKIVRTAIIQRLISNEATVPEVSRFE